MKSIINEPIGSLNGTPINISIDLIDTENPKETKIIVALYKDAVIGLINPLTQRSFYLVTFNLVSDSHQNIVLTQAIGDMIYELNYGLNSESEINFKLGDFDFVKHMEKIINTAIIGIHVCTNETNKSGKIILGKPFVDGDRPTEKLEKFDLEDSSQSCLSYTILVEFPIKNLYDGRFSIRIYTRYYYWMKGGKIDKIRAAIVNNDENMVIAPGRSVCSYEELFSDEAETIIQNVIESALEVAGIPSNYVKKKDLKDYSAISVKELREKLSRYPIKGEE